MAAVYILLIILSLLALLLLIPMRILIRVNMDEQEIIFKYAFLSLKIFPREEKKMPPEEKTSEDEQKSGNKSGMWGFVKEAREDIVQFLTKLITYLVKHGIRIRELNISAKFGVGDPAYTGLACGAAYTAVYNVIGFLKRNARLENYEIHLDPNFDDACFSGGVYTKLQTRAVHFFIMLAIVMKHIFRIGNCYRRMIKKAPQEQTAEVQ